MFKMPINQLLETYSVDELLGMENYGFNNFYSLLKHLHSNNFNPHVPNNYNKIKDGLRFLYDNSDGKEEVVVFDSKPYGDLDKIYKESRLLQESMKSYATRGKIKIVMGSDYVQGNKLPCGVDELLNIESLKENIEVRIATKKIEKELLGILNENGTDKFTTVDLTINPSGISRLQLNPESNIGVYFVKSNEITRDSHQLIIDNFSQLVKVA